MNDMESVSVNLRITVFLQDAHDGEQSVNNSLPVVLTTRREHLETMLGDFNLAFSELGRKFSAVREARALYLEPWEIAQTMAVVDQAVAATSNDEKVRLTVFAEMLRTPGDDQPYGDLVRHPLFLQFILEDVAEGGVDAAGRTRLIQRWVERKDSA